MSLDLTIDTSPAVRAKAHDLPVGRFTELWDIHNPCNCFTIGDEDFAQLVFYWLTNVDLAGNDPRRSLLQRIRQLKEVPGFNAGNIRLG